MSEKFLNQKKSNTFEKIKKGEEMYQATTIGNFFIEAGIQEERMITPMQVVKLVYIAHGWFLAFTGKSLIDEGIQAWMYGPVVSSVYHTFKRYGRQEINNLELGHRKLLNEWGSLQEHEDIKQFLQIVWEKYGGFTGVELSSLTHQTGTPWYIVWEERGGKEQRGAVIPNYLIQEHFAEIMKMQFGHA
ncbi:MAG: type II toxin-antitoxin system antitoxin SocA domain-containing protein [Bacteroidota bacterium]